MPMVDVNPFACRGLMWADPRVPGQHRRPVALLTGAVGCRRIAGPRGYAPA